MDYKGVHPLYDANGIIGYTNENVQPTDYITIIKDGSGVGRVRLMQKGTSFIGTMGGIRPEHLDVNFLYGILQNTNFEKHITGATIPHVYFRDYGEDYYKIPTLPEQSQIGTLFQQLDNQISHHRTKLQKLQQIKQAMLTKMFPQDGAKVPEVRFEGFEGDWEEKKLGEIGSVAMNKRIFKYQTSEEGEIPFYKIGTFGGKPDAFISKELFEEYKKNYSYPKPGDILISASGSIGRTVEYKGADEYFQDSNIVWLEHDNKLDNKFLKYTYSNIKWEGLEGSTIKRLYNRNILNTKIKTPSLPEQSQIGSFFQQLDTLLTQHQKQLDKLGQIKSALLDKLFV